MKAELDTLNDASIVAILIDKRYTNPRARMDAFLSVYMGAALESHVGEGPDEGILLKTERGMAVVYDWTSSVGAEGAVARNAVLMSLSNMTSQPQAPKVIIFQGAESTRVGEGRLDGERGVKVYDGDKMVTRPTATLFMAEVVLSHTSEAGPERYVPVRMPGCQTGGYFLVEGERLTYTDPRNWTIGKDSQ